MIRGFGPAIIPVRKHLSISVAFTLRSSTLLGTSDVILDAHNSLYTSHLVIKLVITIQQNANKVCGDQIHFSQYIAVIMTKYCELIVSTTTGGSNQ